MPRTVVSAALALCLTLGGCAGGTVLEPPQEVPAVQVEPVPSGARTDPATVVSASVEGDLVVLEVRHGGGCREHDFALYAPGGFLESHPVQAGLALTHDAHGDPCRALVGRELRFDLAPLRDAYRRAYGTDHGAIVLHVREPGGAPPSRTTVTYTF